MQGLYFFLLGQCSHRIPSGQNSWRQIEHVQNILWHYAAINHYFKDEFLEPFGRHDKVTLFATVLSPGVFYAELGRALRIGL